MARRELEMTDKQRIGCLVALLGAIIIPSVMLGGGCGSRGTKVDYKFTFKGQPAKVVHEDIRWGPDRYYRIEIEESTVYKGKLITDDKKLVIVESGLLADRYCVKEYQPDEK
ncbi:hypothetical protein GOV06_00465 [Candidatus Woesearchaeota archaeon]|nr:hypothetical protein [Candidatus Woesearchaeota archaeon]